MKLNRTLLLLFLVLTIGLSSCKKKEEDPSGGNESELITTVKLKFTEGGTVRTFTFRDLDGAGGNAPVVDNIILNNGRTYTMEIELLDESNPAKVVDITEEIAGEADAHQFFFTGSALANLLTITYDDKDKNNRPLGLKNRVVTRSTGTGQLTVILRHELNKAASGVANGQIANAGGETDIEVTFNVTVQ
ncbi:MAG: hypothetical protein OHK0057_16110 [Thermoflexibacter sp.]